MEKTYRYRGFDIVVNALRLGDDVGRCDTTAPAYMAGVKLSAQLPSGEWSTAFRAGPVPGRISADLREVFVAGFAAATRVIDDVVGVMGDALVVQAA
ncbi:hypothetical protein LJ656_25555 [Paraburkholderia sp. MMS20-SJTR3]|uniref:Uncharacterized protein n=1 Tax=Paraburkholderia sejongensis TaxID=2886946 RepID=A0ABS8K1C2_9BURK|nr:hypothetical protein [Paraburkholderia sp. MMS20-SJTR3]MCC8395956.1 hypothetical protein [Paraburkholderia sp. MMS20-SJTR3]